MKQYIVDAMNSACPKVNGAYPIKLAAEPDIVNNVTKIKNDGDQFNILTDAEATDAITHSLQ